MSQQQVNLYQPIFRKQKKKFSAMAMLQASAAVVAGIVLLYAYTQWHVVQLKSELKQADKQLAAVNKRLESVTQKFGGRARGESLQDKIDRLERQIRGRQRIQEILRRGIFSNTEGFSSYFAAFARQHIPGVWLTGFDITGAAEEIRLQGRSTNPSSVPRYMQKLSAEESLSGIEFHVFQMTRPEVEGKRASYVEFLAKTAGSGGNTP
ncbi:MAG: hypothetical protein BMS9Abin22_547 [Gammaproteobacteria bacterium]|nr:MAG: hypothetical protein BMS9Abin22_547 [Gammaproteobacteria bacterium]